MWVFGRRDGTLSGRTTLSLIRAGGSPWLEKTRQPGQVAHFALMHRVALLSLVEMAGAGLIRQQIPGAQEHASMPPDLKDAGVCSRQPYP
jgi:hypothetical protein